MLRFKQMALRRRKLRQSDSAFHRVADPLRANHMPMTMTRRSFVKNAGALVSGILVPV
jgi:hypothetical protein